MQEELEALGISLDETDDRFEAQLPEAVTDEDAAREAAEAIARLRAEGTDSVTVQVALDGGSRLAVTFDGPRFSLAPMHTARTSGDPAHLARFRELAERIDAWRIAGGSPSQLVAELWRRAHPAIAQLDAATLARVIAPYEGASRGKQRRPSTRSRISTCSTRRRDSARRSRRSCSTRTWSTAATR